MITIVMAKTETYNIQDLGAGSAYDINQKGQIAGWSTYVLGQTHATLWDNGKIKVLGTLPGGTDSTARSINNTSAWENLYSMAPYCEKMQI